MLGDGYIHQRVYLKNTTNATNEKRQKGLLSCLLKPTMKKGQLPSSFCGVQHTCRFPVDFFGYPS